MNFLAYPIYPTLQNVKIIFLKTKVPLVDKLKTLQIEPLAEYSSHVIYSLVHPPQSGEKGGGGKGFHNHVDFGVRTPLGTNQRDFFVFIF